LSTLSNKAVIFKENKVYIDVFNMVVYKERQKTGNELFKSGGTNNKKRSEGKRFYRKIIRGGGIEIYTKSEI